ncbi:MAG TPA: IS3 family transposase [Polyangia bacterium]
MARSKEFWKSAIELCRERGWRVAEVARELGVKYQTLYSHVQKARDSESVGARQPETLSDENRRLRRENERLAEELEIGKKSGGLLRAAPEMRFGFIRVQKAFHAVRTLCRVLEVSRSGFYAWCRRPASQRAVDDSRLVADVAAIFDDNKRRYGSQRITRELRDSGVRVGRHRVRRLMHQLGLRARRRRRWVRTTDSRHSHPIAANLLARNFSVDAPNRAWVADITYVPTKMGWLYLAVVIDLFSRAVVGWSMSRRIDGKLTLDALDAALLRRRVEPGLIAHSDRGTQYAATDYQQRLQQHGMLCSMSRKGNCWDNAVAESFFATLKIELLGDDVFADQATAQKLVFEYIETYYNRCRRHSTLGYVTPAAYEEAA